MKYDAILVLGKGIREDGSLPEMSVESIKAATNLLKKEIAPRLILCGKWSRHYLYEPARTEASAMKDLAISLGALEEKIFTEEESLDTISNFYYVKKRFLLPNNWKRILLLTLHKNDERAPMMAKYILGPSFICDSFPIGYNFPPDRLIAIKEIEKEKMLILKNFFKEHKIRPGDDEKIFQEHLRYIDSHNIKPTFRDEES